MLGTMSKACLGKKLSLNDLDAAIQITKYLKLLPKATLLAKKPFTQSQGGIKLQHFQQTDTRQIVFNMT